MSWFQCGATGRSKTAAAWATLIHSLTPPMTQTSGCRMSAALRFDERAEVPARRVDLAGRDRDVGRGRDRGVAGDVVGHEGLLHPPRVIGLDHPDEPDRFGRCAPGVVGIEGDAPVATDELADALDPGGVLVWPEAADLDLDVREAELEVAADLAIDPLEGVARPVVAARGVRLDGVPGPAKQPVDGLVAILPKRSHRAMSTAEIARNAKPRRPTRTVSWKRSGQGRLGARADSESRRGAMTSSM